MLKSLFTVLMLVLFAENSWQKEDKTLIQLKQGLLSGKVFKTYVEKVPYYSYQAIPYAEPPIGPLRFQAPVPHKGWNDTFKAHKSGPVCMQLDPFPPKPYLRTEDCLVLNVFSPNIQKDEKLPVMFWVHGGEFKRGSGSKWEYSPDFFIEENVIVISINYRLDIPGFLDLEDEVIGGNMGIKDVVLALKWVKENVEEFGGDPDNVTIFGQEAGAIIIDILLLVPVGKGLFHKAILQSGVSNQPNYFPTGVSPKERAHTLLKYFKEHAPTSEDYIRKFNDIDLMEAMKEYIRIVGTEEAREMQRGILPFSPTIEKDGPDAVLTERPENITPNIDIPVMIGYASRESTFQQSFYLKKPEFLTYVERDFYFTMPIRGFRFIYKSDLLTEAENAIKDFYYPEGRVRIRDIQEYINMTSDSSTIYAIDHTVKKYAQHTSAPLYYYRFSYHGELNLFTHLIKAAIVRVPMFGAANGDDICYLFRCIDLNEKYDKIYANPKGNNDLKTLRRMVRMWVNFAKTGNPTPEKDDVLKGFIWKPVKKDELNFIDIDIKLTNDQNPFADRMKFWDEFIEKYSNMAVDGVAGEINPDYVPAVEIKPTRSDEVEKSENPSFDQVKIANDEL